MWLAVGVFMVPIAWMVLNSFRQTHEIVTVSGLSPDLFIPSAVTLDNYANLLNSDFVGALFRSLLVAGVATAAGLAFCSLAGFALAVIPIPYREALFALVVISFAVPTDATAFALLRLARGWGLIDTYAGLILPVMIDGLVIFLLRQSFLGIPHELSDAARVDGASWWRVFLRIYMPLAVPALVGGALILFITQWSAYLWPLLVVNDPQMYLAPIALTQAYQSQFRTIDYGLMLAGSTILTVVPALFLLPLQRYYVQSVAGTAIKA
jgi:multiple sugar transport system permease protein/putative chitobiose transport system permease protein